MVDLPVLQGAGGGWLVYMEISVLLLEDDQISEYSCSRRYIGEASFKRWVMNGVPEEYQEVV